MEEEREEQVTLQDYLRILYRGRWIIVVAFLAAVSSTLFFTLKATKIYQANTTIMIETTGRGKAMTLFEGPSYIERQARLNNYVQILKSRTLAKAVIQRLKGVPSYRSLTLFTTSEGKKLPLYESLRTLQSRMTITPIRDTDIIEVRVEAPDPAEAAIVANAIADVFYEQNLEATRGEVSEVRKFLEEQLKKVREDLARSEEALKEYKEREKLAALPTETQVLVQKLAEFEGFYKEAQTDLGTSQRRLEYLRRQLREQQESLPEQIAQVSSPLIHQLREEIAKQEAIRANFIAQGVPEDHPKMVQVRRRIEEIKSRLMAETRKLLAQELALANPLAFSEELVDKILKLEIDVKTYEARTRALKRVVDEYAQKLQTLPEKSLQLARLEREAKVQEKIYIMMMEKYEEARITEAGQIGNVRIVDRAEEPLYPIKPRKKLNLILAALVGLGLGVGVTFLLEYLDTSIKTFEEIERQLGLSVLGEIPNIWVNEVDKKKLEKGWRSGDEVQQIIFRLITHFEPKSHVSEAYRTLRTNIQFAKVDYPLKTLLVTSSSPKEGKSTTVANIAITLAQMGSNVLLVDADLRRPVLHSIFELDQKPGLTEVLMGTKEIEEAIKPTEVGNLSLVPSGPIPPNPSELLGSQVMQRLIEELKEEYDYLLFDSPPVIAVTDAAVLSSVVDGVILVIQAGKVSREAVLRAKSLLDNVAARIIGVVLNNIKFERGHSYYYYYRYYYDSDQKGKRRRGKAYGY